MVSWQDVPCKYSTNEFIGLEYEREIKKLVNQIGQDTLAVRIVDMDSTPHTWHIGLIMSRLGFRVNTTIGIDQSQNACGFIAAEASIIMMRDMRDDYKWYYDVMNERELKDINKVDKARELLNTTREDGDKIQQGDCIRAQDVRTLISNSTLGAFRQIPSFGQVGHLNHFFGRGDDGYLKVVLREFAQKTNKSDFYVFVLLLNFNEGTVSKECHATGLAHFITIAVGIVPPFSKPQPHTALRQRHESLLQLHQDQDREHTNLRQRYESLLQLHRGLAAAAVVGAGALAYRIKKTKQSGSHLPVQKQQGMLQM